MAPAHPKAAKLAKLAKLARLARRTIKFCSSSRYGALRMDDKMKEEQLSPSHTLARTDKRSLRQDSPTIKALKRYIYIYIYIRISLYVHIHT